MQGHFDGFIEQPGDLVLTTGNKSETAVGYSTLYGDTAGGFGVLKDVPKTMVYELQDIETLSPKLYRKELLTTTTAELAPDQKDTDSYRIMISGKI